MKSTYSILLFLILLAISVSCSKEKEEFLEGNWEMVNISNIEDTHYQEWNFTNSVLTISRVSKLNPGSRQELDNGNYRLKSSVLNTKLRIDNTSNELFNNDWDVLEIKKTRLILRMDITGGVLYYEFIKRANH